MPPPTWRWIPPIQADGPTQMALDRWMLDQLAAGAAPMLRLYRWSRPTLSLGRHQHRLDAHWPGLVDADVLDIVRRPSGGRAVLHAGDLTYALVCRPGSQRRPQAYAEACRWLCEAFAQLGQPLRIGASSAAASAAASPPDHGRSSCFASSTAADLVHANGAKRIGSAQLWQGPFLLQHGSLLLSPDAGLWQRVFGDAPPCLPPLTLQGAELEALLVASAQQHLCAGGLREQPLSAAEWQAVRARQASSPACIDRATGASPMPRG